ncbi:hypothetical protein A5695_23430 [Mycobacterium sp. E1747]|nr:hypothetical protein A5695_23430 [Mycobacterium sp. E1747]
MVVAAAELLGADLQIHPTPARPPSPPSGLVGRRTWIAVAVALVLLGAGVAWGLQRDINLSATVHCLTVCSAS